MHLEGLIKFISLYFLSACFDGLVIHSQHNNIVMAGITSAYQRPSAGRLLEPFLHQELLM